MVLEYVYWCIELNVFLQYSVVLFNFRAHGLEFPETPFLQEQRIEIATTFAPGLLPKAHTPAVYDPDPQSKESFSIGFY